MQHDNQSWYTLKFEEEGIEETGATFVTPVWVRSIMTLWIGISVNEDKEQTTGHRHHIYLSDGKDVSKLAAIGHHSSAHQIYYSVVKVGAAARIYQNRKVLFTVFEGRLTLRDP
jgi:hypothetical protein